MGLDRDVCDARPASRQVLAVDAGPRLRSVYSWASSDLAYFHHILGLTEFHYPGNGTSWKVGNRIFGISDPDSL